MQRWAAAAALLYAFCLSCSPSGSAPSADASLVLSPDAETEVDGICKSVAGLPPEVIVGQGQSAFLPLTDLETVQVEQGPQGGHHIWMAVRMKNLLRSGSRTTITGASPATGIDVAPLEVIFTFDAGEGGYCLLYGLRFQLDTGGGDYQPLLGKELDLTITVTDTAGDSGEGHRRVTLSSTVL